MFDLIKENPVVSYKTLEEENLSIVPMSDDANTTGFVLAYDGFFDYLVILKVDIVDNEPVTEDLLKMESVNAVISYDRHRNLFELKLYNEFASSFNSGTGYITIDSDSYFDSLLVRTISRFQRLD